MKKYSSLLFFIAVVAVVFLIQRQLKLWNDHKECSTEVTRYTDKAGTLVTVKEHVCREKFNFE